MTLRTALEDVRHFVQDVHDWMHEQKGRIDDRFMATAVVKAHIDAALLAAPETQLVTPENWNDKKWYPSKDQEYLVAAPGEGEGQHGQCHSLSACPCCYGTPEAHKKVTKHCLYCEHAAAPTPRQSEPEGLKAILLKYRDSLVLNHDVGDRNIHYESLSNELFALAPSATEKGQAPLQWLDDRVEEGRGKIELSLTEEGNVGVFLSTNPVALGIGDTVEEALENAIANRAALGTTEKPQLCGHLFLAAGDKQLGIEPAYVDPPCELSSGHEGQHKAENDLGTVSWGR